jgi:hypothetical protein
VVSDSLIVFQLVALGLILLAVWHWCLNWLDGEIRRRRVLKIIERRLREED